MPLSRISSAVTLAAMAIALAACSRVPDVVKIGVAQPLSGPQGPRGNDTLRGAEMAVAEINASGGVSIDGKKVRLQVVSEDDHATEDGGEAAAHKLVGEDVEVAIADLNSQVSMRAAPVYVAAHTPQISTSTNPAFTRVGAPTALRLVANDDAQARAMGQFASQLPGATHFAVVDDGSVYGKALAAGAGKIIAAAGKDVRFSRSLDSHVVEFGALIDDLKSAQVDVLVSTLSDFQVVALADQLADKGMAGITVIGGNTIKTSTMVKRPPRIHALYASSPIVDASEFSNGADFLARFVKAYGAPPVYAAHYAYDAVFVVADALSRNGSVDKEALLKTLKTFDGNCPVTDSVRFTDSGEQRYGAVAVYQARAGAWDLLVRSDHW